MAENLVNRLGNLNIDERIHFAETIRLGGYSYRESEYHKTNEELENLEPMRRKYKG